MLTNRPLQQDYKELKAESPWVKRLPSEYLMEHVWVGSHPLEQGFRRNGSDVVEVLEATPGLEDRLIFCSDYPHMIGSLKLMLDALRALPVADGDKAGILGGSAQRLLSL